MAFIFYFIVILVSTASVMFGIDLATSPLPSTPEVPIGRVAQMPQSAHIRPARKERGKAKRAADNRALSPVYPVARGTSKHELAHPATGGAAPKKEAPNDEWLPPAPPQEQAATRRPEQTQQQQPAAAQADKGAAKTASNGTPLEDAKPQQVAAQRSRLCDVAACDAAYRSFRASDCTYQPYRGARRLCTKSGGTATASPSRRARRYQYQGAEPGGGVASVRDQHEIDEVTRIVRQMTRGEHGDIAVQDSYGRIIIVHPGPARAYSPYDNYYGGD